MDGCGLRDCSGRTCVINGSFFQAELALSLMVGEILRWEAPWARGIRPTEGRLRGSPEQCFPNE